MPATVGPGSTGEAVRRVQRALARRQLWRPCGPITGVFDAALENSVKRFQRLDGLTPTGIVDPETWMHLPRYMAPSPRLRLGDAGPVVARLQQTLSGQQVEIFTLYAGSIDGLFGPRTEQAVQALQSWAGVISDGVVTEDTWFICLTPGTARQLTLEDACGLTLDLV